MDTKKFKSILTILRLGYTLSVIQIYFNFKLFILLEIWIYVLPTQDYEILSGFLEFRDVTSLELMKWSLTEKPPDCYVD